MLSHTNYAFVCDMGVCARFVTGHAPTILKARTAGGVQTALAKFRNQTGSDVFWFRLTPLHPNIVVGDPQTMKHILLHGDQKKYRKGFAYDVLRVIVPLGGSLKSPTYMCVCVCVCVCV